METRVKKGKKLRLNYKRLFHFVLILAIIIGVIYYFLNLKIRFIEINGTQYLTDTEIITQANIKDYPNIFSLNTLNINNNLKELPLVNDVNIKENIWGKLTINIDESKVLFFNKTNNKVILSNSKEINNDSRFLGVPTLLNYVPDDIYTDLINGLTKIDGNVLRMISEIEYSPSKSANGEVIDNTRFLLRMNDGNTVYMNTINITQLNKYMEICSAILATQGEKSGTLYLDSSTEENYSFESYTN